MTDSVPPSEPIALYRERTVADVLNAVFSFLRSFAGPLLKALVYFAGPFLVLAQIVFTFNGTGPEAVANSSPVQVAFLALAGALFNVFGSVLATTVALAAVRVYRDEGSAGVTLPAIWEQTKAWFGRVLGTSIVVGVGVSVVIGTTFLLAVGLTGGVTAAGSPALIFPVGIVLGVATLAIGANVVVRTALTLPARVLDSGSAVAAVRRSISLVSGHFWTTLAIVFLASAIAFLLSAVFSVPALLVRAGTTLGFGIDSTIVTLATGTVAGLSLVVVSAVPTLAAAFQYVSLVEAREHAGLAARVEEMERSAGLNEEGEDATGAAPENGRPVSDPASERP